MDIISNNIDDIEELNEDDYDEDYIKMKMEMEKEDITEKVFYNIKDYIQDKNLYLLKNLTLYDLHNFLFPNSDISYNFEKSQELEKSENIL